MANLQKQTLPLPELDIVEEMLRLSVTAKKFTSTGIASAFPLERVSSNPTASLARERKNSIAVRARNRRLAHR